MDFTGELETHLTVCLNEPKSLAELQEWGATHGLKFLHIVLEEGMVASQPMLTKRTVGKLSDEIIAANQLKELLVADGFPVLRIKIEAAPWNEDVPQSSEDVTRHLPERYFESHIRILYPIGTDNSELVERIKMYSAHLSRNAFRQRHDCLEERFVTHRCWSVGYCEARQKLNSLLREIRALSYTVIDVEEEYVVFDTNLEIDAGWIKAEK